MDYAGCVQWSYLFVCPAELEAEGDRLTAAHTQWMKGTHHREGERALLFRLVTKGPHPSRPDAVVFALTEVYRSQEGFDDHIRQVHEEWDEFPAWQAFVDKCDGAVVGQRGDPALPVVSGPVGLGQLHLSAGAPSPTSKVR